MNYIIIIFTYFFIYYIIIFRGNSSKFKVTLYKVKKQYKPILFIQSVILKFGLNIILTTDIWQYLAT